LTEISKLKHEYTEDECVSLASFRNRGKTKQESPCVHFPRTRSSKGSLLGQIGYAACFYSKYMLY